MILKNSELDVNIENFGYTGEGVARINDYVLFIPGALKGEKVHIKVIKANKNYGFGKLMKIIEPSEHRVKPLCNFYEKCGGCSLSHMDYESQLNFKTERVKDCLRKIGGLNEADVKPCLGMKQPNFYRNKVQLPAGEDETGKFLGFYQERSHRIVKIDECMIQGKIINETEKCFTFWMNKYNAKVYKEEKHEGDIRHLMVRFGRKTGEVMAVIVTRTASLPHKEELIELLKEKVKGISSIVQNINGEKTNVVLGKENRVLYGKEYIEDYIGELKFRISPLSFFQVNPWQTEVLYGKALEFADLSGEETVFDAYCGTGTISLFLAKKAKKVYGVEIVKDAIDNAKENAKINNIDNAEFIVGASEEEIPKLISKGIKAQVMVVDPPRKGCDEKLLEAMCTMAPGKIVYVSCDPATLARDLKFLTEKGYEVTAVQPVDMFPETGHVECVVGIRRKDSL